MPEIITTCTRCQRQLRVPEELQGRLVKCPACEITFTVTQNQAPPASLDLGSRSEQNPEQRGGSTSHIAESDIRTIPPLRPEETEEEARSKLRSALTAPATYLLMAGVFGLLGTAMVAARFLADEAKIKEQAVRDFQNMMGPGNQPPPVELAMVFAKILLVGFGVLSLAQVAAAIQTLRLRMYWLAITGAVLAMFNVSAGCLALSVPLGPLSLILGCGCDLLNLPAGIWALVVLLRPGTSSLFR